MPAIALGMGRWTAGIARAGLTEEVRQVVIPTVGAAWSASYETDAHGAAARAAGVPAAAVEAVVARTVPSGLSPRADVAHRLTVAPLADHAVPDGLYDEALAAFGESGLIAVLCLIGHYQTISSILVCFQVPVPPSPAEASA